MSKLTRVHGKSVVWYQLYIKSLLSALRGARSFGAASDLGALTRCGPPALMIIVNNELMMIVINSYNSCIGCGCNSIDSTHDDRYDECSSIEIGGQPPETRCGPPARRPEALDVESSFSRGESRIARDDD